MSIGYIRAVWFIQTKTPAEKLVLFCLADHVNEKSDGVCWPSYATMARECELTRDWIRKIMDELIERKLISKEPRYASNGHPRSNSYRLLFSPIKTGRDVVVQDHKDVVPHNHKVGSPKTTSLEPELEPEDRRGGEPPKKASQPLGKVRPVSEVIQAMRQSANGS